MNNRNDEEKRINPLDVMAYKYIIVGLAILLVLSMAGV